LRRHFWSRSSRRVSRFHVLTHVNLKPGNVVIDGVNVERPLRLLMAVIDLDVALFSQGRTDDCLRWRGTLHWVASEVGT
jgi:hypothetical protein